MIYAESGTIASIGIGSRFWSTIMETHLS